MQELVREYLNELGKQQKKRRRVRIIIAVFAVVVIGSVVWSLSQSGIAMTGEAKCGIEEHTHGDGCYSDTLICGQEEHAGHAHGEGCWQTTQTLICGQEESEEHVHSEGCWQTEQALICGQEENAGHAHTDACHSRELACGMQEHIHTDACFVDNSADVESAAKWAAMYESVEWKDAWGEDLVIAAKEQLDYTESVDNYIVGEDGSHKGFTRYGQFMGDSYVDWDAAFVNFCMKYAGLADSKMFPNEKKTSDWYDKFVQADEGKNKVYLTAPEGYEPKVGDIVFTKRENEETDIQMGIVSSYDKEKNEIKVIEGNSDNRVKENTYAIDDKYISEYLMISDMEQEYKKQDDETAVGTADETEGAEPEIQTEIPAGSIEKVYTDDTIIVKAVYEADAEIPDEAELIVEQITAEGNEEHYAEREAEFKEALGNDKAVMKALLKIGFYVNGEEVEPKSPVTITVQFLDENGLAEGKPVTIVHFADKGAEVLNGSEVSDNCTTFRTESFSYYGFTDEMDGAVSGESRTINRKFQYEDELFHITFTVQGKAVMTDNEMPEEMKDVAEAGIVLGEGEENKIAEKYQFKVNMLNAGTEDYNKFADYAKEKKDECEQLLLQVMKYSLYYDGKKLDLADCEVTAAIKPTANLKTKISTFADRIVAEQAISQEEAAENNANLEDSTSSKSENGFSSINTAGEVALKGTNLLLDTNVWGEAAISPVAEEEIPGEDPEESGISEIVFSVYVKEKSGEISRYNKAVVTKEMLGAGYEEAYATANLSSDTMAVRISRIPNPKFTVQYYANLDVLATSGTNALTVIDTSGGILPTNKGNVTAEPTSQFEHIYVDSTGKVQTVNELTEVYSSRNFEYYKAPTINYMNALVANANYELKEIWVLIDGKEADSTNRADWDIHTYKGNEEKLHFTNREISVTDGDDTEYVMIKDGATIRLVYDTTTLDKDFSATFYDYDISNGLLYRDLMPEDPASNGWKNTRTAGDVFTEDNELTQNITTWLGTYKHIYSYTIEQGINSSGNYSGIKEGEKKLAFGNVNTGTGLGKLTWSKDGVSNELNKYNNKGYQGCTFGLVTGMSDGKIQYASGIKAPNLFNEGDATGKTSYDNYSLKFNRVGDTYTLSAVNGTGAANLGSFSNPTNSTGEHTNIWTNNFWPMDSAPSFGTGTHDVKFGGTATFKGKTHELRFGPITQKGTDYTFPESDDGEYHNSYFGMHYNVEFELEEDYVGPLEYYFFGDDDMWVFLDGQLVCDIGGVHSSVGEYVNLWDYLQKGTAGSHTLSFFYTERGASGSTCWMQFTLPSVSSLTPETANGEYGHLKVEKDAIITEDKETSEYYDTKHPFEFTIKFTDKSDNELPDDYTYTKYDRNGKKIGYNLIISDGGTFTLNSGEYIVIQYLPVDTQYEITEIGKKAYFGNIGYECDTEITLDDSLTKGDAAKGDIKKGDTSEVKYTNKATIYKLPSTGGSGIYLYMFSGVLIILGASLITYRKKCRGVLRS